jgi:hypothetical protein
MVDDLITDEKVIVLKAESEPNPGIATCFSLKLEVRGSEFPAKHRKIRG